MGLLLQKENFKKNSKVRKSSVFLMTLFFSGNSLAHDFSYLVKKGDNLSGILFQHGLQPLYGKKGVIQAALRLNPKLQKRKNLIILPGEKIKLPIRVNDSSFIAQEKDNKNIQLPIENSSLVSPQGFYWSIAPIVSWKSLSSDDENYFRQSNIQALSSASYGFSFLYGMNLKEDLSVYSQFFLEKISFKNNNSIQLLKHSFTGTTLSLGVDLKKKFTLEAGMDERFILTSYSNNTVEIKKISLPRVSFNYKKNFWDYQNASIGTLLKTRAFLPRSHSEFETKLGYGFGVEFNFNLVNQSFVIGYDYDVLNSKNNTTNAQNIFWQYQWKKL